MLGQFGGKMTENGEIRSQFCRVWNHETLEPIWGLAVAASGMVKKKFEMTFNARAYGLIKSRDVQHIPWGVPAVMVRMQRAIAGSAR